MKNYKEIFERIVNNTEEYVKNAGLKSMVLGISGGIDSTVVAAVCHEVSKRNPDITFIGVTLPANTNSIEENDSASYALQGFCDETVYSGIENTYTVVQKLCDENSASTSVSRGNIKARLRMIYLYNMAGLNQGIVMDTDNLTEHYLGFFTIHGDQGDLNPIGKLWKTEVYELARYLKDEYYKDTDNENIIKALEHAIEITPTDGNGVWGTGDLDQIMPGYTYADVDKVLQFILSKKNNLFVEDVYDFLKVNHNITFESFMKVHKRYHNTMFKRQHSPFVISIDY